MLKELASRCLRKRESTEPPIYPLTIHAISFSWRKCCELMGLPVAPVRNMLVLLGMFSVKVSETVLDRSL